MTQGPEPPIRDWAGYPLGFAAATAVTIVAAAAGGVAYPLWTLGALATTAGVLATLTTLRSGLATAAVCWALHSGFVLGRHGDLVFDTRSVLAAALLVAVVLIGYGLGRAARAVASTRPAHP